MSHDLFTPIMSQSLPYLNAMLRVEVGCSHAGIQLVSEVFETLHGLKQLHLVLKTCTTMKDHHEKIQCETKQKISCNKWSLT